MDSSKLFAAGSRYFSVLHDEPGNVCTRIAIDVGSFVLLAIRSCRQPHVQFIKDGGELVAEEFVGPPQAADRVERHFFQVVLLDVQAAGDVVLDGVEPPPLVGGERDARRLLFGQPLLIPLLDRHADRSQRRVRVDGVAHQGDHVHELLAALAPHLLRLDHLKRLPEPGQRFRPVRVHEERRLVQLGRQFLDVPEPQARPIRLGCTRPGGPRSRPCCPR